MYNCETSIILDMSRAFNAVNNCILLKGLEDYGEKGNV